MAFMDNAKNMKQQATDKMDSTEMDEKAKKKIDEMRNKHSESSEETDNPK